jgi:hypothetical protein
LKRAIKTKPIRVLAEVHELLSKAAKSDPIKPTLGQVVTKMAYEQYGYLLPKEA